MERVIIFGTGKHWKNHKRLLRKVEIIAFADNDNTKVGKEFEGKPIIHPSEMTMLKFDKVIIASVAKDQIIHQLFELKIAISKIELLNCYRLLDSSKLYYEVKEDESIWYRMDNITFSCKTRSDFNVVQELYDTGVYHFRHFTEKYYVVDIGMNIGLTSLYFAGQENIIKVYGFEPFEITHKQAVRNISMNESFIQNKIATHRYGLGGQDETKYFNYNPDCSESMSTVGCGVKCGEYMEKVIIKDVSVVLQSILQEHINDKAILKIDCEGSEYEILERLDQENLLRSFSVIMLELHIPEKNHVAEEILDRNGYRYFEISGNDTLGFIYAIL